MNILNRVGKQGFLYVGRIFIFMGLFSFFSSPGFGKPFRLEKIPDQGKNFKCRTCHVSRFGGKEFNPFGNDYKRLGLQAGDNYTEELGALDSDGDGFSNKQEFDAKTNPGNPKSKPE
ncbi:MAG: hypothetical protein JW932_00925 [Deltaproteobacteria bacterium]|nr:hypothetical protein [Deltaproteobacteria bacterium]